MAIYRNKFHFSLEIDSKFKQQLAVWANGFKYCSVLDSNDNDQDIYQSFEFIVAVSNSSNWKQKNNESFDQLRRFYDKKKDWLFGFLSYDLKNEIEDLQSNNPDSVGFPEMFFFQPEILIRYKHNQLIVECPIEIDPLELKREILQIKIPAFKELAKNADLKRKLSKKQYLKKIKQILEEIKRGEVYELNMCQEFYVENLKIDPLNSYLRLQEVSPAPFACFFKMNEHYLICSSPERFMKKHGQQLISQPIKGTIHRGENLRADKRLKKQLLNDPKERSENVMIVDLVRNDLTRSSEYGSIEVAELFGIYSFKYVHQMISTVSSKLRSDVHFIDAIKNTFPMGSMTGCPKIRAMELIEHYEESKRGLYSGAVGYLCPQEDFDFNVVIRSLLYNKKSKYLSFQIGGAITIDSDPEKEYEECLLKAKGILKAFTNDPA